MTAGPASLTGWSDGQLLNRLLAGAPGIGPSVVELEGELARRCADAQRREDVRRLLKGYASAAPEYVDEDAQAAARRYLAVFDGDTSG
ncbi:MAG: hypothetical protein AVDCRST_MAG77-5370 [uncultured Chloroflexi bacterium]|uniref:Uncharacterized protein n=1 Tax=uncultured Chloroflexota bacterium TaxID=166587 RepID=A0A6J4K8I5_9CHLR|nr:MAG: hypothetical protein AVDCRST_MAG77-5370 [uncultured Chloroflexota bacterium]